MQIVAYTIVNVIGIITFIAYTITVSHICNTSIKINNKYESYMKENIYNMLAMYNKEKNQRIKYENALIKIKSSMEKNQNGSLENFKNEIKSIMEELKDDPKKL